MRPLYPPLHRHHTTRLLVASVLVGMMVWVSSASAVSAAAYRWAQAAKPLLATCAADWQTGLTHYDSASGPYQVSGGYAVVIDQACRALPPVPHGSSVTSLATRFATAENKWFFDVTTGDTASYRRDAGAVSRLLPALRHVIDALLAGQPVPTPRQRQSHVVARHTEQGVVSVSWTAPSGVVQSYEVLLATPAQFTHYQRTGTIAPAVDVTGLSPNARHYVVTTLPKNGEYYVVLWAHVGATTVISPLNYPRLYLSTGPATTTTTTVPINGGPLTMPTTIFWDSASTATVTFSPTAAAITTISQALSEVNTAAIGTGQVYRVQLGIHATTNGGTPATCSLVGSNTSNWLYPQTYFCRHLQASLAVAAQYHFVTATGLVSASVVTFRTVTSNDNLG